MSNIFLYLNTIPILKLGYKVNFLNPKIKGYCLDFSYGSVFINKLRTEISEDKRFIVILNADFPEIHLNQLKLYKEDIVAVYQETASKIPFTELISNIYKLGFTPSIILTPNTPIESIITMPIYINNIILLGPVSETGSEKLVSLNNINKANNFNLDISIMTNHNIDNINILESQGAQTVIVTNSNFII